MSSGSTAALSSANGSMPSNFDDASVALFSRWQAHWRERPARITVARQIARDRGPELFSSEWRDPPYFRCAFVAAVPRELACQ